MGQEWGTGVYIATGSWNIRKGFSWHQMHRSPSCKDAGLAGFLCAMQRFNASDHLYLQIKMVLGIAAVAVSQL